MKRVTLSGLASIIGLSERTRVIKNGVIVFANWGYFLRENYAKSGFTGDETVIDLKVHLDVSHKDWKKRGLIPPLDREHTPQYLAGDMQINMYYDIYIL